MKRDSRLSLTEIALFGMFGALIYCAQLAMSALPNIHLTGMFIMLLTLLYRGKALIPIYLYVFLEGISARFALWWVPYLYLWTVLWGVTMLLPKHLSDRAGMIVYPLVCGLFGLAYGTLYAPGQALLFGYSFRQMLAWIVSGLPFDALHGVGNLAAGLLIVPLLRPLRKLAARTAGRQKKNTE